MPPRSDDQHLSSAQLTNELRKAIALGRHTPGDRLPSNVELQQHYRVSGQTVQNAVNALKTEGIVYSVPGKGVYVRDDLDPPELLAALAAAEEGPPVFYEILGEVRGMGEALTSISDRVDDLEARLARLEAERNASD